MWRNYILISFRKLNKNRLLQGGIFSGLTTGYISLMCGYYMFQDPSRISGIFILSALLIFAGTSIFFTQTVTGGREVYLRKLYGASMLSLYKRLFTEALILSLISLMLALIILDQKPFEVIYENYKHLSIWDYPSIVLILLSVLSVSSLCAALPAYRLSKSNLGAGLRKV